MSQDVSRSSPQPPTEPGARSGGARRRWTPGSQHAWPDLVVVLGLVAIGVVVPLVIGGLSGAAVIPHNDDPSMRRVALGLFETGRLAFNGWTSMTLVGQVVFAQPFLWVWGGGPWAFAAATAVLATAGIVASYSLARRLLTPPRAALAVVGVLCFPGFLLNTTSFMTDVPTWSASMTCLAIGASGLARQGASRWRWLVASLAVGCFAFSIREFAIAAPIAVVIAEAAAEPGRRRRAWVAGAAVLAVCGMIYLLAHSLPGQHEAPVQVILSQTVRGLGLGFSTLALVVSPAIVLGTAAWWHRWRALDWALGAAIAVLAWCLPILTLVRTGSMSTLLVGDLLQKTGNLGIGALAGGRPVLFREPAWSLLNAGALVATIAMAGMCGGALGGYIRSVRARPRDAPVARAVALPLGSPLGMVAVFAAVYGVSIGAWGTIIVVFDRYLWMLVLPLYILMLIRPAPALDPSTAPRAEGSASRPDAPRSVALLGGLAGLLVAGLGAVSLVLLLNADAFESARWRIGELAVARGVPAGTVDAGLEWVAFHSTSIAAPNARAPVGWSRYDAWWPSFNLCAMASTSPLHEPGFVLMEVDRAAYRLYLFAGPREPLYLYRVPGPGCP